jgi:LacI family transcriptional regulator
MRSSPGGSSRPTLRQVAEHAGVGFKTVARVVNGEDYVSAEMTDRVRRAIDELGYVPDDTAGSLRRAGRLTRTLGLTLSDVANPLEAQMHAAIEAVATQHDVATFAASVNEDPDAEVRVTRSFLRRRVDGLILTPVASDQSYLRSAVERGTPIVFVDRDPVGLHADSVVVDNARSSERGVAHLAEHGHRQVAYLGDRESIQTARERHTGYTRAVTARGLADDPRLVVTALTDETSAYAAARALLESSEPPTALFTAQNLITVGAVRALHDLGMEHHVALVGFDDVPLGDLLRPAVTVISHDLAETGRIAAERVFRRLAESHLPPERIVLPTNLIRRGSGEIWAADAVRR